jgi:zinc D-Ala-D-Ala carboxypeptidase
MKLSENFSLDEFTRSDKAKELGIENVPEPEHLEALSALVINVLQPLREHMGESICINSGYRSKELNSVTKGSSSTSQHCKGEAADLTTFGFPMREMFLFIKNNLPFDQLIWEFGGKWVHVSYTAKGLNRKQSLESHYQRGKVVYCDYVGGNGLKKNKNLA